MLSRSHTQLISTDINAVKVYATVHRLEIAYLQRSGV